MTQPKRAAVQMMKQPMNMAEHEWLALQVHTALYEMINGTARPEEWRDLADAVNIVEALCDMGKVANVDIVRYRLDEATVGLKESSRYEPGLMHMHRDQALCLRSIISTYDRALGSLSRGTIREAKDIVIRKMRLAKASANEGVIVI